MIGLYIMGLVLIDCTLPGLIENQAPPPRSPTHLIFTPHFMAFNTQYTNTKPETSGDFTNRQFTN